MVKIRIVTLLTRSMWCLVLLLRECRSGLMKSMVTLVPILRRRVVSRLMVLILTIPRRVGLIRVWVL